MQHQGTASPKRPCIFRVTEIVNPCLRSAFLQRKILRSPTPETLQSFEIGRAIESRWIEAISEQPDVTTLRAGVPCRYVNPLFEIRGRADVLLKQGHGPVELYEVKTYKGHKRIPTHPYRDHVNQLQFYLNALSIESGTIAYVDRDVYTGTGLVKEARFPIQRNRIIYSALLYRTHRLYHALDNDITPPRERCWKCLGYCPYEEECNGIR